MRPEVRRGYFCDICEKTYVVPALARSCEEKHLESEYGTPKLPEHS